MENFAKYFDHTLLKPDATEDEVRKIIAEAKEYRFASVCINPYWVKLTANELQGTGVTTCTVIGFPLGATTTVSKVAETAQALHDGATEVDMVINIGELIAGHDQAVQEDIQNVARAAHAGDAKLKVIIETSLLTDEQKAKACELAVAGGTDFVKTSTGFSTGGANAHDVAIMRKTVGAEIGVKASGGIHSLADARAVIDAGANRIGASASVAIMKEYEAAKK
ncbi:deoxyribose-phosphate aldolase [Lapidilactobacillus concavus DSM 17758]|uniref:Deoxyribose-phosphate aldolase n=1 Tax=Lapidilactobacillus concavus DSM 17758 TaxID=1423735 RepID=A0A0R1WAE9_9LACO|nr:deoxyribose-phosphate aldolase [Lapidilactobacillus concavus]KRM12457.1 deoxyribose-phosphate aldolase [Lapidilactobacillus concavus DSM 17758]GEL13291.1 deoxyribose-phosphate aldolase [Lapidilactobacillus concavus]